MLYLGDTPCLYILLSISSETLYLISLIFHIFSDFKFNILNMLQCGYFLRQASTFE